MPPGADVFMPSPLKTGKLFQHLPPPHSLNNFTDNFHARAVIRRLLFSVSKFGEQSFERNERMSAKHHLRNESRRDNTGRGNAKESASTSNSSTAKRNAESRSVCNPDG